MSDSNFKLKHEYMWQFVSAGDGRRSPPFLADLELLSQILADEFADKATAFYVLLVCDPVSTDPDSFVSVFPLMYVETFVPFLERLVETLSKEDNQDA